MATTVSAGFTELLGRLDLTTDQAATASGRSKGLKDFFDNTFVMASRAFTIGSYRRGTLIRPTRDIDLLAPLDYPTYKAKYDNDSRAFLYHVRDKLNSGYATTKVSSREVAVVLDFSIIRADVVPAFPRGGGGYLIPNGKGIWQTTHPAFHTRLINDRDTELASKLKPVIRVMKFWNATNGRHLRSLHVELMTWRMWKSATSLPVLPNAVAQSIKSMAGWAGSSFQDPAIGDPHPVDSYLSAEKRAQVIRMLQQDAKAAAEAEEYRLAGKIEKAFERWNSVFCHEFPAYG